MDKSLEPYIDDDYQFPKFNRSMVKDHTILIPSMLDIHMSLFEGVLTQAGYKVEICKNEGKDVVETGLKYVHNDTCFPALLVIGQFIDNLNHRNDHDKLVLLITQTGGGCRASNYIHLLRKALIKAGYGFIPVLSLNAANLEKDAGLDITFNLVKKVVAAMTYGDHLMYLRNKTRSYEKNIGDTKNLVDSWEKLPGQYIRIKDNGLGKTIDEIGNLMEDKWFNLREFFASFQT